MKEDAGNGDAEAIVYLARETALASNRKRKREANLGEEYSKAMNKEEAAKSREAKRKAAAEGVPAAVALKAASCACSWQVKLSTSIPVINMWSRFIPIVPIWSMVMMRLCCDSCKEATN